jgi:hypothetical protein
MPFSNESRRSRIPLAQCAAGYFEKPVAGPALKVMVVLFAGNLIESSQFGSVDLPQPSSLDQQFQVAIDGCLVQRANGVPSRFEDLVDAQRSIDFEKNSLDGIPLIRFPLHTDSESNPSLDQTLLQARLQ